MKLFQKIILTIFIIGIVIVLYMPVSLFVNYLFEDLDFCLDTGYCKEGLTLNTEKGKIIVSKESCIGHNGIWEEKYTRCQFPCKKYPVKH